MAKFDRVVFELYERTYRQTDIYAHHNTSYTVPAGGEVLYQLHTAWRRRIGAACWSWSTKLLYAGPG